jgi:acyl-ACP thioesterase
MSILLTESRKEDLRKKYAKKFEGGTGLDFILNIADLEDFNHKYTDWVLKNVDPESENFDDDF